MCVHRITAMDRAACRTLTVMSITCLIDVRAARRTRAQTSLNTCSSHRLFTRFRARGKTTFSILLNQSTIIYHHFTSRQRATETVFSLALFHDLSICPTVLAIAEHVKLHYLLNNTFSNLYINRTSNYFYILNI